jgi:hypothetical protein
MLSEKPLIKSNLHYWMEDKLVRAGWYDNVTVGETNFYGHDISRFIPITDDPDFIDGRVWQSAFKNWVYASGIPAAFSGVAAPFVASGVVVDGTFYSEAATGIYAHQLDFENGRVIFDNVIAGSPVVQGAFSYQLVSVRMADELDNENQPVLLESFYKDNPAQTGVATYPSAANRTLPAIFIDVRDRKNSPYELGTRNSVKDYFVVCHLYNRNPLYQDRLEDFLANFHHETILGINFSTAPFPLGAFGERDLTFTGYSTLASLYSGYFWRRIYLEEVEIKKVAGLFNIQRSQAHMRVRIYPNF